MSSYFPNGARYAVSTTRTPTAAAVISALTNAAEAVATAAAPPVAGAIVVLDSGWPGVKDRPIRAKGPTANSFILEGVNTTDTARFPAGQGVGTFQTYGGFVVVDQVRSIALSGGDQSYFNYAYMEDDSNQDRQKPTSLSPMSFQFTLDYDPAKPWYQTLQDLHRINEQVVLRETLKNNDVLYYLGYASFNPVPSKDRNENMTNRFNFSFSNPIRYPGV
jgi:Phage tail tube protein, TTP